MTLMATSLSGKVAAANEAVQNLKLSSNFVNTVAGRSQKRWYQAGRMQKLMPSAAAPSSKCSKMDAT
jgi:hypothetical protein